MKKFFRRSILVILLIPIMFLAGCGQRRPNEQGRVDTAMGTVVRQTVYVTGGDDRTEEILKLVQMLEEETLSWRMETSETFQVNAYAGSGKWVELSEELSQTLEQCRKLTENSGGAFDVALGPVARLWDIDSWASGQQTGAFQVPGEQELDKALAQSGMGRVQLEFLPGEKCADMYLEEGAALDFGAVGKGLALDMISRYLETDENVTGAVVSVGGSVLTYGEKPDGTAWRVGIANPNDPSVNLGILTLTGQWFISTSGDYERYVESEGMRYHHIFDPATGYPADSGVRSATVLSDSGFLSDALSTACFVLGVDEGMKLAEEYGAEVLFVDKEGNIVMSEGMEKYFFTK